MNAFRRFKFILTLVQEYTHSIRIFNTPQDQCATLLYEKDKINYSPFSSAYNVVSKADGSAR